MTSKDRQKGSIVNGFLNSVEKIGNKLPDPSVLFFLMCWLSYFDMGNLTLQCIC